MDGPAGRGLADRGDRGLADRGPAAACACRPCAWLLWVAVCGRPAIGPGGLLAWAWLLWVWFLWVLCPWAGCLCVRRPWAGRPWAGCAWVSRSCSGSLVLGVACARGRLCPGSLVPGVACALIYHYIYIIYRSICICEWLCLRNKCKAIASPIFGHYTSLYALRTRRRTHCVEL